MTSARLYDIECILLATLLVAFALAHALRRLGARRAELAVGRPIAAGVALRLIAIVAVNTTGLGATLRGGDEVTFVQGAREIAGSGLDSGLWVPTGSHRLQEIVFALQIKLGDFPTGALRVTQVGIAMLGVLLLAAAIHDLAGPRAARIGAWVLAVEPASVFFNSILHREPLLVLASGLVVFGGAKVWRSLEWRGVALLGLGCLIALATRPYAAWFLMTGGLLLILHAAVRRVGTGVRSIPLIYAVVVVVAAATPAVLALTSQQSLKDKLQSSQEANTDPSAATGGANSNNLSLERVDFSSRAELLTNLPRRVRDVLLRPYPWQLQNTSQQLGAIGTLVALAGLALLVLYAWRSRGRAAAAAAPIIYPMLFLLVAYALSVGNAGTGFRYRTHLVLLGLAALAVLHEQARRCGPVAAGEGLQEGAGSEGSGAGRPRGPGRAPARVRHERA